MPLKITKRPLAEEDIIDHWIYIAKDNPIAADAVCDAIEETFQNLAEMPLMGTTHVTNKSELSSVRMFPVSGFKNYLILYIPSDETLEIVRVIRKRRSIKNIFP